MITCIVIVGSALYWLGKESSWLRVNLMGYTWLDLDYDASYDGSDSVYLDDYEIQFREMIEDCTWRTQYKNWISEQKTPVSYIGKSHKTRDDWFTEAEDRRNGTRIYTRSLVAQSIIDRG